MAKHLIDGEFQSDKYPTTPRGKVPLSCKDKSAQDLLWEYAQRRRMVDAEFSDDLEAALRSAGFRSLVQKGDRVEERFRFSTAIGRSPASLGLFIQDLVAAKGIRIAEFVVRKNGIEVLVDFEDFTRSGAATPEEHFVKDLRGEGWFAMMHGCVTEEQIEMASAHVRKTIEALLEKHNAPARKKGE